MALCSPGRSSETRFTFGDEDVIRRTTDLSGRPCFRGTEGLDEKLKQSRRSLHENTDESCDPR